VPHDDDQSRPVTRCGKLDASDLRGRDDVPRHADDEEITEALIEDELCRHTRIRAAEDDRKRLLPRDERLTARAVRERGIQGFTGYESAVAFTKARERFDGFKHADTRNSKCKRQNAKTMQIASFAF
jgi:hypothetical protein